MGNPPILQGTPLEYLDKPLDFVNQDQPAPAATPNPVVPLAGAAAPPPVPGTPVAAAPTAPAADEDQGQDVHPIDQMASAFMAHLINKDSPQPAPPGSFASKLGGALNAASAGLGDAAAANNGGKGGWLGGVARTLQARSQRKEHESEVNFEHQERLKNDQINLAKANIEMRNQALAIQRQEKGLRDESASSGAAFMNSLRDNYKVSDNISQDRLTQMMKSDPDFLRTHTGRITGYQPVYDAQGQPRKDANGNPVESPVWSVADLKPGDMGNQYTVSPETAKRWSDSGVKQVQPGTIMPVSVANQMDMKASRYATTLGILNKSKVDAMPAEVKDQLATALEDPEVQHAVSMTPGSALDGLYSAQKNITDHIAVAKAALDNPQVKDKQSAQEQLGNLQSIQSNVAKAINLGFTDKERSDYAKEKDAAAKEAEKERHDRAQEALAKDKLKALAESSDPKDAEELGGYLAAARMDPSQLSKRAKNYNASLTAANKYSMEHYGVPFDIAQAQTDYKYANQKGTKDTLNYLNSLTGADNKSGNLSQLVTQSNGITRTEFPALNDAAAWARLETGDPAIAAYKTTITEVADQVAKILQGGGSGGGTSDAKLKQASEMFRAGFTKDQIKGIAEDLRGLLANRKTEMIGKNRYLMNEYGGGYNPGQQPQNQNQPPKQPKPGEVPQGAKTYNNGAIYSTDGKTFIVTATGQPYKPPVATAPQP